MDLHSTPSHPPRLRCGDRRRRAGLTLVEVIVAAGMIGLTCSVVMFAFTQLNQMAMITRLYTGAATQAMSQIDLILTDTPFEPQNSVFTPEIPSVTPAATGTKTTTSTVTVYQDPISNFTINGTMTTTITADNTTYTSGSTKDTLYLYLATVQISYNYRGRSYSLSFSTSRTSDI